METSSAGKCASGKPVAGLLLLLWLVHWLPFLFPQSRLWGINHLLFVPLWGKNAFGAGGLFIILLFIPAVRNIVLGWFSAVAEYLFSKNSYYSWILVSLISAIVFWLLRPDLFWLGDSYSVPVNIGNTIPTVFKWSELGAVFTANAIARFFPQRDAVVGRLVYAGISVISGGLSILLLFALARALAEDVRQRLFLWCVMVFGGWLLLFFGYTENYPILWPFVIGYQYFSVIYLQKRTSLLWPAVFLLLSIFMHMQVIVIAPTFLVLAFAHGRGAKFYHRNRVLVWTVIPVGLASGLALIVWLYNTSPAFKLNIVPLFDGYLPAKEYTLFSWPHIADCINLLLLVAPLTVLFSFVSGVWSRPFIRSKQDLFFTLSVLGGLLFLCLMYPRIGMGRDWDLFALSGFYLLIWFVLKSFKQIAVDWYPAISLAAVILVLPFLMTQLSDSPSRSNFKYLLSQDISKARTGMYMLKTFYKEHRQTKKADSLEAILRREFPEYTLVPKGYSLVKAKRYKAAQQIVDSLIRINPYSTEVLVLRGNLRLHTNQLREAIADLTLAASLGRYDSRLLGYLGSAYGYTHEAEKAFACLRKALKLNPENWEAYQSLAIVYYDIGQFDSSYSCLKTYIKNDGKVPESLMLAGFCAYQLQQYDVARRYFDKYLAVVPNSTYRAKIQSTMASIR